MSFPNYIILYNTI